ncbi:hypothetical protein G6514_006807 [Epicoccum nigrum]|nr:hypothetical protein G6514_006807 [Epicoccum nigrum]
MDEATTASPPPSKAPISPGLAAHPGDSDDQPSLIAPIEPESGVDAQHSNAGSARTPPDDSTANVLEVSDEAATARSNKRARAEVLGEDDSLPPPKRVAEGSTSETEPTFTIAPTDTADGPDIATNDGKDDASVVAEPEEQPQKSRKPTLKKTTAKTGRSRACATCKRRKVKCTHNTTDEETTIKKTTTKKTGVSKPQAPVPTDSAPEMDNTAAHDMPTEKQPPKKPNARKQPAPKKPTAPPERASTRTRRPPPQLEDLQPPAPPIPPPTKKPAGRVFDSTYITTNSTSRLAKADLYHLLTDDASAWTSLTPSQQATLISMLPSTPANQRLLQRIGDGETQDTRPSYLSKGDVFRTEVAKFKEDLRNGHLAKTWRRDACVAVQERAEGLYDGWKRREAEAWWGQKSG